MKLLAAALSTQLLTSLFNARLRSTSRGHDRATLSINLMVSRAFRATMRITRIPRRPLMAVRLITSRCTQAIATSGRRSGPLARSFASATRSTFANSRDVVDHRTTHAVGPREIARVGHKIDPGFLERGGRSPHNARSRPTRDRPRRPHGPPFLVRCLELQQRAGRMPGDRCCSLLFVCLV